MRIPLVLLVGVLFGTAPTASAQVVKSKQCGCDLSAHEPSFDCNTYCCTIGGWKNQPICKNGPAAVAVPNSTGGAVLQTAGGIIGALMQYRDQKKTQQQQQLETERAAALQRQLEEQRQRELAERQRFELAKRATLSQMKGPRPGDMTMKDIGRERQQQVTQLRALGPDVTARVEGLLRAFGGPSLDGEERSASPSGADARPPIPTPGKTARPIFDKPTQGDTLDLGVKGLSDAGLLDLQAESARLRRESPDRIVDPFERALIRDPAYLQANEDLDRAREALQDAINSGVSLDAQRRLMDDVMKATARVDAARSHVKVRR